MKKRVSNGEEIGFGDGQIPIEDLDELALDPSNVTFAERAGDHSPMYVFESRVVGVFGCDDESAEEDTVQSPFLCLNGEIGLGSLDVDEGNEEVGERDLGSLDNVRDKLSELGVLVGAGNRASARRGGGGYTEGHVYDLSSGLNDMFCERKVSYIEGWIGIVAYTYQLSPWRCSSREAEAAQWSAWQERRGRLDEETLVWLLRGGVESAGELRGNGWRVHGSIYIRM